MAGNRSVEKGELWEVARELTEGSVRGIEGGKMKSKVRWMRQ